MNRSPIIRSLVQTLLGAQLVIGTQPRYKAPGELRVEIKKRTMTIDFIRLKLETIDFIRLKLERS